MGPASSRFWLPLTRLGAFFVTVVVVGNVVFHAFRPSAADLTTADESSDYFLKKRKRIQKQIQRNLEKFLGVPPGGAPPDLSDATVPGQREALALALSAGKSEALAYIAPERKPEPVSLAPAAADRGPLRALVPLLPSMKTEELASTAPEPSAFVWPEPLALARPALPPVVDIPGSLGLCDDLTFRSELVTEWCRRSGPDPLSDVAEVFLKGPELLIDGFFTCAGGLGSRPAVRNWDDDEGRSITAQMLDVGIGPRQERIGREFLLQVGERESRYFGNFSDSRANSFGFENGTQDASLHDLALDQRKVFWDALRRTYLARYKVNAEEKIKDDAWYLDRWTGWDFAVLPPLLGAYVYYRGLDKKLSVLGSRLTVSIEPVSEWARRTHEVSAAASVEWSMKGWPLGVIVSAGLHEGRYGLDFVGIGTSIGTVRQALEEKNPLPERR